MLGKGEEKPGTRVANIAWIYHKKPAFNKRDAASFELRPFDKSRNVGEQRVLRILKNKLKPPESRKLTVPVPETK